MKDVYYNLNGSEGRDKLLKAKLEWLHSPSYLYDRVMRRESQKDQGKKERNEVEAVDWRKGRRWSGGEKEPSVLKRE